MNDEQAVKQCTGPCARTLPVTTEYFYRSKINKDGWYGWCKDCRNTYQKEKMKPVQDATSPDEYMTVKQIATRSGQTRDTVQGLIRHGILPALKVTSKYRPKDGEWRVKIEDAEAYIAIATEIVSDNATETLTDDTAPIDDPLLVLGTPDQCGSCGAIRRNIMGDVNDTTHERYGYLCGRCHRLLECSHEDIERVRNLLRYLEKTRVHPV